MAGLDLPEIGSISAKDQILGEALRKIVLAHNSLARSSGSSGSGVFPLPKQIAQLVVNPGTDGSVEYAITDNSIVGQKVPVPLEYFLEWSTDPNFANPLPLQKQVGPTRNSTIFVGAGSFYFRAFSQYPNSNPSLPTWHGGNSPTLVAVTNVASGVPPTPLPRQGSGSSEPGTPGAGFGRNPRYTTTGQ